MGHEGWNPAIDVAIVFGGLAIMLVICYIGDKYFPIKKEKLRGASRV